MFSMNRPKPCRHQQLDGAPQELATLVSSQPFGLQVGVDDPASLVDNQHAVRKPVQDLVFRSRDSNTALRLVPPLPLDTVGDGVLRPSRTSSHHSQPGPFGLAA